jgi:hypothetical protein
MFVDGPPEFYERNDRFECTDGYFWPIADTILAAAIATTGVILLTQDSSNEDANRAHAPRVLLGTPIPLVSAGIGVSRVNRCRDALRWTKTPVPEVRIRPPRLGTSPAPAPTENPASEQAPPPTEPQPPTN